MRWTKADSVRLNNAVSKFNRARGRWIATHRGSEAYLPPKQNYEEARFQTLHGVTRSQFNAYINSLERATRPDAFKRKVTAGGEITTKYSLEEANIRRRSTNLRLANFKKKIKTTGRTKKAREKKKQARIEQLGEDIFVPKKSLNELRYGELDAFLNAINLVNKDIQTLSRLDEQYKQNYLKAMREQLGISEDSDFYQMIENMSAEDIAVAYKINPRLDIDNQYRDEDAEENATSIYQHWQKYIEDYT